MSSTKVDNRAPLGSKRSRNEPTRNDGDWDCPNCGNMNFSFRTVCNRGKCGTARPSPSPRNGSPIRGAYDRLMPHYYSGIGASSPMPYGMSGGYGGPIPGMRYDYGLPSSVLGPYGPLSPYAPSVPMGAIGYGSGPGIDQYGYVYRGSPLQVPSPWSTADFTDNNTSRKRRGGPDGFQEGDWVCPNCENVNFAFRTTCNMKKCGTPKPLSASTTWPSSNMDNPIPDGSWTCSSCNNLNYPFRTVCNRKGCTNEKPSQN